MRAALIVLLCAGCTQENDVRLTFGDTSTTPLGFRCRGSNGLVLDDRAVNLSTKSMHVAIVTDFIRLDGYPTCRPSDIVDWCQNHPCAPIDDGGTTRSCIEVDHGVSLTDDPATVMGQILAQNLPGQPVTGNAPDEPVIIRVVATAQDCNQVPAGTAFDESQLVGCVFSCPVQLDQVSGDILLDLPTVTDRCEDTVIACATTLLH